MDTAKTPAEQGSILGALHSLRDDPEAQIEIPGAPKPATTESAAVETPPASEKNRESAQVTGEPKQESTEEEDHTPLPPKIQARIDKEIAKQVSLRKELEAKLKATETAPAKQGTEPVKPAAETNQKPKRPAAPQFGEGAGNEAETWAGYQGRLAKYHTDLEAFDDQLSSWIVKTTESETRKRIEQQQARDAHEVVIQQAIKDHGEDFLALTQQVADHAPIEFQHALLDIEDWPTLAVYLARNQDKLTEVVEKFKTRPIAAIETLGRMRAGLKGSSSKDLAIPEKTTKPLPAPLRPVAGSGTIAPVADLNKLAEKPGALQGELRKIFPERVAKYG